MDGQRVPNLEEMDEEEATRLLTQLASALSPEGEYQIRHPEDYVMEICPIGRALQGAGEREGLPGGLYRELDLAEHPDKEGAG